MPVDPATRHHLVVLAKRREARRKDFTVIRPTDWRPQQVRNPNGLLDTHFSDSAAWELIASKLEEGHPLEEIKLDKPPGATGYVMLIDLEPRQPKLYVKLQLGSGQIIGRSFHYSERND